MSQWDRFNEHVNNCERCEHVGMYVGFRSGLDLLCRWAAETYEACLARTEEVPAVECSLCGARVSVHDACSTLACRGCHRTISFEDCLAGGTGVCPAQRAARRSLLALTSRAASGSG